MKIAGLKTFIVGNPPPRKGGRYFIDSVITPGYADTGPDQRGGG